MGISPADAAAVGGGASGNAAAPVASLLMPIYNVERYLEESIASARAQTLRDIEIICIDDGSTDGSPQIIARAAAEDERIRVITKANSGYGDSMNRGLDAARGAYIAILEPDDIMYPRARDARCCRRGCGRHDCQGQFRPVLVDSAGAP